MKTTIIYLILITKLWSNSFDCLGQNYSIEPQLISSSGGFSSNSDLHSSLGENFIAYIFQNNLQATCGFYQSSNLLTVVKENLSRIEVELFPNPTSDLLTIKTQDQTDLHFDVICTDGRRILSGEIKDRITEINLAHFSIGLYQLRIANSQNESSIYKIIKTN